MMLYVLTFIISLLLIVVAFQFQELLVEFKSLGLLGIFLINFFGSATLFLPAPAIASVFAGGALYSPLLVALTSSIGGALGEMVGFFLGHSGHHMVFKTHKRLWRERIGNVLHRYGDILIFLFALIPNPVFDIIGIAAGFVAYSPLRFFIALLLGRLVRNILLAYFGARLI